MINRTIILFFLANFIVGTFLIINFKNKTGEKVSVKEQIIVQKVQEAQPERASLVVISTPKDNTAPICMEYGPLDIEQKSIIDNILNKEHVAANKSKRSQYEVYWNLGQNEMQAKEMFDRQKQGALQDNKFQLTNSEGFWMVSITRVDNNIDTAKSLAASLSDKANRVNAGGRWQYRTLPDAYYYQVKNINELSTASLEQITKGMAIGKKPCEA